MGMKDDSAEQGRRADEEVRKNLPAGVKNMLGRGLRLGNFPTAFDLDQHVSLPVLVAFPPN